MRHKPTQMQTIFYQLYQHHKSDKREEFLPIFQFMGEVYMPELGRWGFMSYELPARFADIKRENPNLLEQKLIHGKSGAKYFGYRLRTGVKPEDIKDPRLLEFYRKIRKHE